MKLRLALATRSADKTREIREILQHIPGIEIASLDRLSSSIGHGEERLEEAATFHENALAKARYFAQRIGLPTLADDSGLVVDALGGDPGVRSKRFAMRPGLAGPALDAANNALLLERLRQVPAPHRSARFVCASAFALPHGPEHCAIASCAGQITEAPRGQAGFGYDPLFYIPPLGKTLAELSESEKNHISHRARAFRALAALLLTSGIPLADSDPTPFPTVRPRLPIS
ncbi:MAG: RdgB/HAM1 family non-canonical purine NTP pyrophosphatase [Gemmatimonadetes bacterium]|nr:RdgB/HAM1 family non-canonical purine NTP pyrophosphatase [Gemmatimonadota bacterium]